MQINILPRQYLVSMRLFLSFILLTFFLISGVSAQTAVNSAYRERARAITASLDDSSLAAQVLLTGIEGRQALSPAMRNILRRIPAGGIMLFRYNLDTTKNDIRNLLSEASALITGRNGIAPYIAVDHEGGLVHRFGTLAERPPSAYSFWELAQVSGLEAALLDAETIYRRSAMEIRELGINMVLGPVVEILNSENRAFLDTRSYGPDVEFTQAAASAYVRAMNAAGIASVLKHFPGNTGVDPHHGSSVLNADRAALNELAEPFAGIIRELSPPAVMVSHVMVPALDSRANASLSRPVIEGWLREELGFQGIVIADDLAMGAVVSRDAIVEALLAGVDMIMVWPQSITSAHNAILNALQNGRLPRIRLEQAAERIIAEKLRYGLVP